MSSRQDRADRALRRAAARYALARERVDRAKGVVVKRREAARRAWKALAVAKLEVAYAND